ncbi:MAG TPA: hypothetical protein VGK04_12010 [Thermoanaerobaculia bacterium]|jgi:hypothetical protein
MPDDDREALKQALDALERLMRIFQVERILYLIVAFTSFLLLVFAAFRLFNEEAVGAATVTAVLGGTGLATAAAARVGFFLNRAFKLIEDIVRKLAGIG